MDTCGAYRLPLLQYLCSPNCFEPSDPVTSSSSSSSEEESSVSELQSTPILPTRTTELSARNYQRRIQIRELSELNRRVQLGGLGVTQEEALRMTSISGL